MADEGDPWGFDDGGDSEPAAVSDVTGPASATASGTASAGPAPGTPAAGSQADARSLGGAQATPTGEEVAEIPAEEAAPPPPPPEDDGYRKPVQLYRHWVRPKFLQYKYMYNYRTNYYDDVIDYLDKKQVGVSRDIPRPQTWAERVLRTNNASGRDIDWNTPMGKRDARLVQTLAASIRTYNYHTKAYLNQKYAHVL